MTPSPDGKKLFVDGFQGRGELIRYDAGSAPGLYPFCPESRRVTCVSPVMASGLPTCPIPRERCGAAGRIGSDRLQLTSPPFIAALPNWSPDGTQIAFENLQTGTAEHFSDIRKWRRGAGTARGKSCPVGCTMVPRRQANGLCPCFGGRS